MVHILSMIYEPIFMIIFMIKFAQKYFLDGLYWKWVMSSSFTLYVQKHVDT